MKNLSKTVGGGGGGGERGASGNMTAAPQSRKEIRTKTNLGCFLKDERN
jgi:hypothetical protein